MGKTGGTADGKRVTIYTIAKKLGVSSTTVYRALNNKTKISAETRKAVLDTIKEMDFRPNTIAKSLARKPIRIAFVVSSGFPEFHHHFITGAKQTEQELRDYNVHIDYFSNDESKTIDDGLFLQKTLEKIIADAYDGVLLMGRKIPALDMLEEKGILLATVVNDVPNSKRCFYMHYDGETAGRIAAELLFWRLGKGANVVLATGYEDVYMHQLLSRGFTQKCVELSINLSAVMYNKDNEKTAYANTNTILEKHPEIQGIYINSYNSKGVIESIREHGLGGKIVLVTSDINEYLHECLDEGIVSATIYQNQYRQGRLGIRYLYQYLSENIKIEDTITINPEIILKSNINRYLEWR